MSDALQDQGRHGLGSPAQGFTAEEVAALIDCLYREHVGASNSITAAELGNRLGYKVNRGERNLVSQLDGVAFVLGGWNADGYYIAKFEEEVEQGSHSLLSQATKMLERHERRRLYLEKHPLPRLQRNLPFGT